MMMWSMKEKDFLPKRLRLSSRRDVERRLREIIWILKDKYKTIQYIGEKTLDPITLYSTQKYLESDKMGLVLKEVLFHGYDSPIIVIRGSMSRYYIIDGHHRARVMLWLRRRVKSLILNIPGYKPRVSIPIWEIELFNPLEKISSWLNTWRHMVNIIHFIEKKHGGIAYIWKDKLVIRELITTQKIVPPPSRKIVEEPILVYNYNKEYYVIDGHTRACTKLLRGEESILSVVFTLEKKIGLVDTAIRLGKQKFSGEICSPLNNAT
ncbi:ParB domain protein nuclease [Staphylothermus marinus F1]|uniref:ParB domain protein nuclease n=2 Tax=Staphylothermus marinus TaxID=2280 RepID=A3DL00_STAMF|nr:ParB domain protein nuclease [Staphylothermus marinus F1]